MIFITFLLFLTVTKSEKAFISNEIVFNNKFENVTVDLNLDVFVAIKNNVCTSIGTIVIDLTDFSVDVNFEVPVKSFKLSTTDEQQFTIVAYSDEQCKAILYTNTLSKTELYNLLRFEYKEIPKYLYGKTIGDDKTCSQKDKVMSMYFGEKCSTLKVNGMTLSMKSTLNQEKLESSTSIYLSNNCEGTSLFSSIMNCDKCTVTTVQDCKSQFFALKFVEKEYYDMLIKQCEETGDVGSYVKCWKDDGAFSLGILMVLFFLMILF